jgi:hypothetical protein
VEISIQSRLAIILTLLGVFFTACSDAPLDPEEQLVNILNKAERYLETRELSSAMAYVDPGYQDKSGRDFRALRAMLFGYLMGHESIHIFTKINEIVLHNEDQANVVLFAGLAATAQSQDMTLSQWRGNLLRLEFRFKRSDDDWLLETAQWRRALPEDFSF